MIARWVRRTLRRFGVELPFTRMVCPEEIKTVSIDGRWRAIVTVQRTLVFLDPPEAGDLHDAFPVDPAADRNSAIFESPDARETSRRRVEGGTLVYWQPRERVVPYALYHHKQSWSTQVSDAETTVFAEVRCDVRTGIVAVQMVAPMRFQTGVAFERPRLRRLNTERRLMKYVLARLETSRLRPVIRENRQRAEWRIVGPRPGARYVCIAFTAEGLENWRQHVQATSIAGRLKRALRFRSDASEPVRRSI